MIRKKKGENINTLVTERRGCPLLLGKLDEMEQKYIKAASNRGAAISRSMASATAKSLLVRYVHYLKGTQKEKPLPLN